MYDPLRAKTRVALSVAACFLFGLALASQFGFVETAVELPVVQTAPAVAEEAVQPALDLSDAFVNIAEAVTPSVVRIEAVRRLPREGGDSNRLPFPQQRRRDLPDVLPRGGSGFIISADGYVMTNNHVIDDAERITVILPDGRDYGARVVGTDPTTDIAVIRIDGDGFPAIPLGSSADVEVGEWVLAIGNPGFSRAAPDRLDYTVTAGIVSAVGRSLNLINQSMSQDPALARIAGYAIENFIQTDAVINSGNSGGPMVNLRGQVVGINSAIISQTGAYQGYGFAIPIDLAHEVMNDLIAYGRVRRALLGVRVQSVASEDAEALRLPEVAGALVQSVTAGTPAARAGLRLGDVIAEIDGEEVETSNDLQHLVALRAPGDSIRITLYRRSAPGETRTSPAEVMLRLEEQPYAPPAAEAVRPTERNADEIGIRVGEITREFAMESGLESARGVVVEEFLVGGPAYRKNIVSGCVITEIDGRAIERVRDYREAMGDVSAGEVVSMIASCPGLDWEPAMYNVRVPR